MVNKKKANLKPSKPGKPLPPQNPAKRPESAVKTGRKQTVAEAANKQLRDKVEELEATTNDLMNLLSSTDMAALFLDSELRIRHFTPATSRLMLVSDADVGRPISDLSIQVKDPGLSTDAREVLEAQIPVEKEVSMDAGRWFMRRVMPLHTSATMMPGVVVTYVDISNFKQASNRLHFRERQQAMIAQLGRSALVGGDLKSLFDEATVTIAETLNSEMCKVLRFNESKKELELLAGVGWREGLVGTATVPCGIGSQGGYTLQTGSPVIVNDLPNEQRFQGSQLLIDHNVISGISIIIGLEESPWGALGVHSQKPIEYTMDDANFIQSVANLLWQAIQRKDSEQLLQQRLAEIDAIYAAAPVGLSFVDPGLKYVRINESLAKINGKSVEEHIGKTVGEVLPELAATIEPIYRRVLETGQPALNIEVVGSTAAEPDIEHYWLVNYSPQKSGESILGVNSTVIDITRQKQTEALLAASQRRLQRLVDSASIGIAFARPDGTVLSANDAMLEIFSITRDEFEKEGWDWQDKVLPEDQRFASIINKMGRDQSKETVEVSRLDANGEPVWLLVSARPLDNERSEYVAFMVDITAQKKAEQAWTDSEERLNLATQLAGFGTYYGDASAGKLIWSSRLKTIFGLAEDDSVNIKLGDKIPEFVHKADRARVAARFKASLNPQGDGHFQAEFRIFLPDGRLRWVLAQGQTVFNGSGSDRHPVRIAGAVLDISERHIAEEALKEARLRAETANQAKSTFLANMSHEIRTPMTAILGYADVLYAQTDDSQAQDYIQTIRDNGAYLCEILDDILDLSKIEAGKAIVRRQQFSLIDTLADIRSLMTVRAAEKSLSLALEFVGEIPKSVDTDPKILRQILVNLVGNAIKFTIEGGVRIVVRHLDLNEQIEISIIDTGIGIDDQDLDRLFLPFEQIDNSLTRSGGGTGLGLSISYQLVNALGGELTADSRIHHGSTFRFTFASGPCQEKSLVTDVVVSRKRSEVEAQQNLPLLSGRVLMADDHADIRFLLSKFIESAGLTIEVVEDGEQAVQAALRSQKKGEQFDVILMDIQMPGTDGLTATRELRRAGYQAPIIALTANVMEEDRSRCLDAGCNDVVGKPIDHGELIRTIADWMGEKPVADAPRQHRVLCVDDYKPTCRSQQLLLTQRGFSVKTACSAREALTVIESFTPDVVLLDLGMPKLSGDELLIRLKTNPALQQTTFVCVSGRIEDEVPWRDMGFHRYLQKPADPDLLERVIRETDCLAQ